MMAFHWWADGGPLFCILTGKYHFVMGYSIYDRLYNYFTFPDFQFDNMSVEYQKKFVYNVYDVVFPNTTVMDSSHWRVLARRKPCTTERLFLHVSFLVSSAHIFANILNPNLQNDLAPYIMKILNTGYMIFIISMIFTHS